MLRRVAFIQAREEKVFERKNSLCKKQKCIKSVNKKVEFFTNEKFFLWRNFLLCWRRFAGVRDRNSLMKLFICTNFHLYANWRIFPFDWKIGLWLSSCYFDLLWKFFPLSFVLKIRYWLNCSTFLFAKTFFILFSLGNRWAEKGRRPV